MKKPLIIKTLLLLSTFAIYVGYKQSAIPQNQKTGTFSTSTRGLERAKDSEVVYLKNGDTYDLTAEYLVKQIGNREVRMMGYNGSIPGPFIHVEQGAEITINFTNNTDIETTIHSHGLRLNYLFDGTPDLSQQPVDPGGTFVYKLKFPDAGTYWYHPHIREDYAQELGLYSNYQVKPTAYTYGPANYEQNLILDDVLIEDDQLVEFYKDKTNFALMGRFGNIMLVNGQTETNLSFEKGSVVRFFITNVANARPFEISIPGAKMKLVGSDLSPYVIETFIDKLLITPAERYIIDVYFPESKEYTLMHTSHDLSMGEREYILSTIDITDAEVSAKYKSNFDTLNTYETVQKETLDFESYRENRPDRELEFTIDPKDVDLGNSMASMPCHKMPDGTWMGDCTPEKQEAWLKGLNTAEAIMGGEKIHWEDHTFALNRSLTNLDITWQIKDKKTGRINHDIKDWQFKLGEKVKVRLFNDPLSAHPMQHPFHLHGQRMVVLATNGIPNENYVWKDTVLVPVGDTVDVLVEMINPGVWMGHCHIAEHLSSGMMFSFAVGEEYWQKTAIEHTTH